MGRPCVRDAPRALDCRNEAFSVALDDPDEALGAQRGVLVPLGIDLEWESAADPVEGPDGYSIEATVSGEILIADGSLGIDAIGRWRHEWGRSGVAGAARPCAARPAGPAAHRPAATASLCSSSES